MKAMFAVFPQLRYGWPLMNGSRRMALARLNQRGILLGWTVLMVAIVIATQTCSTMWAFANPAPHHWDNAEYLNQAWKDLRAYQKGALFGPMTGIGALYRSLTTQDPNRPPGYRIITLPFIFTGIRMLALLRAISLLFFWLTLYVIYRICTVTLDGLAGKAAGIFAVFLLSLYVEINWSIRVYGTEFTLYFSTALMLLCVACATRDSGRSHLTWMGLGFAVGLGFLSKVSFALLAVPVGCVVVESILAGRLPGLSLWKVAGAAAIAAVMCWPYYHLHLLQAIHYGQDMTQFERHSLKKSGFALLRAWLRLHVDEGMGRLPATIAGEVLGITVLIGAIRWGWSAWRSPGQKRPLGRVGFVIVVALAEGLPMLLFQLMFSKNDNVRHMTPAYLPLTVAVALGAGAAGVLVSWWSWAVLAMCVMPAFSHVKQEFIPLTDTQDDVWDWNPVYWVCQRHHIQYPLIGHVGNSAQFCDPAILYPWAWHGEWADSLWLWRSEEGSYDPVKVNQRMADRDLVLTAPGFFMPNTTSMLADPVEADNAHNAEFARAMMNNPDWELAGKFPIGVIHPAEIWMFVRKVPLRR
jgi:hypothetical protein